MIAMNTIAEFARVQVYVNTIDEEIFAMSVVENYFVHIKNNDMFANYAMVRAYAFINE